MYCLDVEITDRPKIFQLIDYIIGISLAGSTTNCRKPKENSTYLEEAAISQKPKFFATKHLEVMCFSKI